MSEFLGIVLDYPTIFYSVLLILVLLYWMMVIVGGVDLDALGGGADGAAEGAAEGLAEGAAEGVMEGAAEGAADAALEGAADAALEGAADAALEGAADAALEGAADAALDGAADAAFDGAADAALDGAAEGAAEGAADAAAEGAAEGAADGVDDIDGSFMSSVLSALSLRGIPVTLTLSVIVLFAWVLSFLGVFFLQETLASGVAYFAGRTGIALGAFVVSTLATSIILRPFRGVFETQSKHAEHTLRGEECTIVTQRVDHRFGQARYDDQAGDLVLSVRCDTPNNGLTRGDRALIVDYDDATGTYLIEPIAFMGVRMPDGQARDISAEIEAAAAVHQQAQRK